MKLSSLAFAVVLPLALVSACGNNRDDVKIGADCPDGFCDRNTTLTPSADAGDGTPLGDVPMCPVTTCSLPWATCPSSGFPCSTDLSSDRDNCGGCGVRCGDGASILANHWRCVQGQCKFGCYLPNTGNCDGDPTNGCETFTGYDPSNCGDCGVKCPDGFMCHQGECINGCKRANLPDRCSGRCTNLLGDDTNCGACGNRCDRTGPNGPPLPADMYYGCRAGACGQARCVVANKADCNGDQSDGCEATIHTNEHCNGCNDACPAGKQCALLNGIYGCQCDDDTETWCGIACIHLDDDPQNCGGCNHACPGSSGSAGVLAFLPHFAATCTAGVCGGHCENGYADCDGLTDNGCEVDMRVDNRNCGACGNACLPSQVCSGGKCLVAPCDADAGGPR